MEEPGYIELKSQPASVSLDSIPVLSYSRFCSLLDELMAVEGNHCLSYFAVPTGSNGTPGKFSFFCCIGCDASNSILLFSHEVDKGKVSFLDSVSGKHFQFHIFEREIHENSGIDFPGHPWLKPVRYPNNRADSAATIATYPFFSIDSTNLHEVGVGPIHAGVIEPGHFRFICNGERVLHLEIQLGYQHRGAEELFARNNDILKNSVLAESIAGDTAAGHSVCHAGIVEVLTGIQPVEALSTERCIALELERIAVHVGDTAALCNDVAYQFGQAVCEALRTIVINTTQAWCGNRFGKGLIRPGGSNYPLTPAMASEISKNMTIVRDRYRQIAGRIFSLSSVLSRFEGTGKVTRRQAALIGAVGMAARSSGLKTDIRWSHPAGAYKFINYDPVVLEKGDVWARAILRPVEIEKSIDIILNMTHHISDNSAPPKPVYLQALQENSFAISLTEGWRGEICHCAITGSDGKIIHYKVKDPSLHNWMALALAVRGQEISDFPLCNKSFNLSYCGNDL